MITNFDIVHKISEYLDGKINLDAFREWIVRSHLEAEGRRDNVGFDKDAADLLSDIEGRYTELTDTIVSDGMWKIQLRALISPRPQMVWAELTSFYQVTPSVSSAQSSNILGDCQLITERSTVAA